MVPSPRRRSGWAATTSSRQARSTRRPRWRRGSPPPGPAGRAEGTRPARGSQAVHVAQQRGGDATSRGGAPGHLPRIRRPEPRSAGVGPARLVRGAPVGRLGDERAREKRGHARHRRPLRGDEGGARRLLPDRGRVARRGDRVGGAHPDRTRGHDRDPSAVRQLGVPRIDALTRAYRDERARCIAILGRVLGDLDLAEDAVQDAFVRAAERWPRDGTPANPGAWIVATARNRAIDRIRREQTLARKTELLARAEQLPEDEEAVIPDERLELIFACCHPALAPEAQGALTLNLVRGLTTPHIPR